MKIYVAGMLADVAAVRKMHSDLIAQGHTITHDWTAADVKYAAIAGLSERDSVRRGCADADLKGVREADVIVILFLDKEYPYKGTSAEMGAACVLGKPVIAVCPHYMGLKEAEASKVLVAFSDEPVYARNCFFQSSGVCHVPDQTAALALVNDFSTAPLPVVESPTATASSSNQMHAGSAVQDPYDVISKQIPTHPPTSDCADQECEVCGMRDCPTSEPLHYHHDGCPSCTRK